MASPVVQPKSFGLTFDPPSVTVVYASGDKLRKRTMPVRQLDASSDVAAAAQQLIDAHPSLLAPHLVSGEQIERLVRKLVNHKIAQQEAHAAQHRDELQRMRRPVKPPPEEEDHWSPVKPPTATRAAPPPPPAAPPPRVDSDEWSSVVAATAAADAIETRRRSLTSTTTAPISADEAPPTPSDVDSPRAGAGFAPKQAPVLPPEDEAAAAAPPPAATKAPAPLPPRPNRLGPLGGGGALPPLGGGSGGGGGSGSLLGALPPLGGVRASSGGPALAPLGGGGGLNGGLGSKLESPSILGFEPSAAATAAAASGGAAGGADDDDPEEDAPDLNKVSETELLRHKENMNATFESNRLKPGDAGYVHDRRVDFGAGAAGSDCHSYLHHPHRHRHHCRDHLRRYCTTAISTSTLCDTSPSAADEDSKEANDWDDELEDFESEDEEDLFAGL